MTSLLENTDVQVEVSIQDYFSQSAESDFHRGHYGDRARVATGGVTSLTSSETWAAWFKRWLEILKFNISTTQTYELSLRLTGDREIRSLNAQYRWQDQPTDVLAFAALEADCPQPADSTLLPVYLGDIVISVDTALQQAGDHHNSLERELAWLATHGLLHLLGWDHPDEASLVQMLHQQDVLLEAVGFPVKVESTL